MLSKKELSAQLKEAAQLLEVQGRDPFRVRAYQNAARQLERFEGDFDALIREGRLREIRGIGRGLAAEISECVEIGSLAILDTLYREVPEGVRELFRVGGLGAKKIAVLWQHDIASLERLVAAAEDGTLARLKGFGAKSAEAALQATRFAIDARKRMRLDEAEVLATYLREKVTMSLPEAQVTVAGELRRGLETVGRLDLVVRGVPSIELKGVLRTVLDEVQGDGLSGKHLGYEVRFTVAQEMTFGAVLAYRTGSGAYLGRLQEVAGDLAMTLDATGLWSEEGFLETPTEAALFERLGLPYPDPALREERAAQPVGQLIDFEDVRGLVHNHSTWSDGVFSIREMVEAARRRGYRYLAMGDHSRSSGYANGLSIERLYAQAEEIEEIRAELKAEGAAFELLHGVEVDILPEGELDYPDEVLEKLDYTVVSVHQNFTLSRKAQTARIVKAVRHPHATILGHATGRLLLRRPGYQVDLEAVIEACAEAKTVIEINANPYRLDLDWRWLRLAKSLGCSYSINPDAHHTDGFEDVRYGVMMARKAGLIAEDVVNTAPTGEAFLRRLKRRKATA
jgi:DNA polymerase (family 10)